MVIVLQFPSAAFCEGVDGDDGEIAEVIDEECGLVEGDVAFFMPE